MPTSVVPYKDVKLGQMFTNDEGCLFIKVTALSAFKVMGDGSVEYKAGSYKYHNFASEYWVTVMFPMVFSSENDDGEQVLHTPVAYDGVMHLEKAEISV